MMHNLWMKFWNMLFSKKKTSTPPVAAVATKQTATGAFIGYGNGNGQPGGDRVLFRFPFAGRSYGKNIEVYLDSVLVMTVPDGATRYEPGGGLLWKPGSDNDGKLAIHGQYGAKHLTCMLKY